MGLLFVGWACCSALRLPAGDEPGMAAHAQCSGLAVSTDQHIGVVHQPQKVIASGFALALHQCQRLTRLAQQLPGGGQYLVVNGAAALHGIDAAYLAAQQSGFTLVNQQPPVGSTQWRVVWLDEQGQGVVALGQRHVAQARIQASTAFQKSRRSLQRPAVRGEQPLHQVCQAYRAFLGADGIQPGKHDFVFWKTRIQLRCQPQGLGQTIVVCTHTNGPFGLVNLWLSVGNHLVQCLLGNGAFASVVSHIGQHCPIGLVKYTLGKAHSL